MVTERLRRLGDTAPVVGDLIIVGDALANGEPDDEVAEDADPEALADIGGDAEEDGAAAAAGGDKAAEGTDGAFSAHRKVLVRRRPPARAHLVSC